MSARLLDHYGIKGRRKALHEHNERAKADDIVARIAAGQRLRADFRRRHATAVRSGLSR